MATLSLAPISRAMGRLFSQNATAFATLPILRWTSPRLK